MDGLMRQAQQLRPQQTRSPVANLTSCIDAIVLGSQPAAVHSMHWPACEQTHSLVEAATASMSIGYEKSMLDAAAMLKVNSLPACCYCSSCKQVLGATELE
jgi:hypothetical protein